MIYHVNITWHPSYWNFRRHLDGVQRPLKRKSMEGLTTFHEILWIMWRFLWRGSLWEILGLLLVPCGLCWGLHEVESQRKSWDSPWDLLDYVGYPREEKYNGRIYDFTWDTLDCMEASLKRKLMENPGTVWRSLWREVLWDFPWDPLGCVMASVGNQWDILRLPNKILWTTPFFI